MRRYIFILNQREYSMKSVLFVLMMALILPNTSHAFKWSKCKAVYKPWPMTKSSSKNIGHMLTEYLAQLTSQATSQSSTSTTSYVTSTGDCAAFAKAEEERTNYIAETITTLKAEAAEGQGEHITSLARLYGCKNTVQPEFINMVKSNHSAIFTDSKEATPSDVSFQIIEKLMNNQQLKNSCNLEVI